MQSMRRCQYADDSYNDSDSIFLRQMSLLQSFHIYKTKLICFHKRMNSSTEYSDISISSIFGNCISYDFGVVLIFFDFHSLFVY